MRRLDGLPPKSHRPGVTLLERALEKVTREPGSECWVFCGSLGTRDGYGHVSGKVGARSLPLLVHRVVYEWLRGPVPPGLQLDHLCRNRACCNPAHLEPVTPRENALRGAHHNGLLRRQFCRRGHPVSPENRAPWDAGRCVVCYREWTARRASRLTAEAAP